MSAIEDLRDVVATHSNVEVIAWPRADLVAVLQEIDDLQEECGAWHQRAKELGHYGRHIGAEIEEVSREDDPYGLAPLVLKGESGIELTPAQLVQIIREAGKS